VNRIPFTGHLLKPALYVEAHLILKIDFEPASISYVLVIHGKRKAFAIERARVSVLLAKATD